MEIQTIHGTAYNDRYADAVVENGTSAGAPIVSDALRCGFRNEWQRVGYGRHAENSLRIHAGSACLASNDVQVAVDHIDD